jgi:putative ABC transport system substrate-binding protein
MSKKIVIWLMVTIFLATVSLVGAAQQVKNIPRIGFLTGQSTPSPTSSDAGVAAFRQGLRDLGYIEGKNIIIEYRGAAGKIERMPELVSELIGLGVNVIVTVGMPAVIAAKKATSTIPIVTANADNLVDAGIVASLAHPGGNVTGSTRVDADFSAKRLQLLKESFPKLTRVAVLSHGSMGGDEEELQEIQTAARKLAIQVQPLPTPDPSHFPGAFAEMRKKRADALIFLSSSFTFFHRKQLVELARKNRLPTMCANTAWIDAGCVIAYGPKTSELYRRAAVFVDKILKGAKPADLPVEQPMKFEFIISLKAAKVLNLTIPQSVLFRADKVIQ